MQQLYGVVAAPAASELEEPAPSLLRTVLTFLVTFAAVVVGTTVGGARAAGNLGEFPWQFRLAASLRTPVLMFIVIPLSFVMGLRRTLRTWLAERRRLSEDPAATAAAHEANVAKVVSQIRKWNDAGRPGRLRTARPSWASMSRSPRARWRHAQGRGAPHEPDPRGGRRRSP